MTAQSTWKRWPKYLVVSTMMASLASLRAAEAPERLEGSAGGMVIALPVPETSGSSFTPFNRSQIARNRAKRPVPAGDILGMPLLDASKRPAARVRNSENHPISKNLVTGEVKVDMGPRREPAGTLQEVTSPQIGTWTSASSSNPVKPVPLNFSGLTSVSGYYVYPYSAIVEIQSDNPVDGLHYACSGTLIDASHVITAGHCVNTGGGPFSTGVWMNNVIVYPAFFYGAYSAFGSASAVGLHSWTGWVNSGDYDHDMGLIDLDRPVGALTGWMGYGYNDNCGFFESTSFSNPGYPAESPYNGQRMYTHDGTFDACDYSSILGWYGNEVTFNSLSYRGQSGSGEWVTSTKVTYAVLSNGTSSSTSSPRITSDKQTNINSWVNAYKHSSVDLTPLGVKVSPTTITSPGSLSGFQYTVYNNSTAAWNGTVTATAYLSWDDQIDSTDTNLGSHQFTTSIPANGMVTVSLSSPPAIPADLGPSGAYYIGVILNVNDADNSNNSSDGQDAAPVTLKTCKLAVSAPDGWETWTKGQTYDVTWDSWGTACSANVKLELLKGGVLNSTIASSVARSSGAYSWTVPSGQTAGTDYTVRVTDTSNGIYTDTSNSYFTIADPATCSLTLTAPNGGQTWTKGQGYNVTWTSSGSACGANVKLELLKGGVLNSTIASSVARSSGAYSWTVPSGQTAGTDYTVRVTDTSNGTYTDASNSYFTIADPATCSLTLTAPNGGETWTKGQGYNVAWTSSGSACGANVKLELLKGGVLNSTIASSVARSSGAYSWTVPSGQTAGTDYTVRVTDTSNGTYTDASNGLFTIADPASCTLTMSAPNGGETWTKGQAYNVTWTSSGSACGANVKLELFKGGVLNATIASSVARSSGAYSWTVPSGQTAGMDYTVRVTDTSNGTYSDVSNGTFTIADPASCTLTVSAPNGGETWTKGQGYNVTWSSSGSACGANVKLELLKGGVLNATIASSVARSSGAYSWTVPSGQTAGTDYTVRVTDTSSGSYTDVSNGLFTIADPGCSTPTPTATNNGPICVGATLSLSTPSVSGATYSWTGPNSFSSSLQNPTIQNATTSDSGVYSVTVTVSGCTSAAGSTEAIVNASNTVSNEFAVPTGGAGPFSGITSGPDGNVWFTQTWAGQIGRVVPTGIVTEFSIPTPGSGPEAIVPGPDGALWFAEYYGNKIGRITAAGVVTEFPIPTASSGPVGIAAGPDGNLWFTEYGANKIGRITTAGSIIEVSIPTPASQPWGIVSGSDGALWFTENSSNRIGRISTSGAITEFLIPTAGSWPIGIASGADGNLWFAESNGSQIGRITTSGVITEYSTPTSNSGPNYIAAGSDGNLWFTESIGNVIARITTTGVVTEFPIPTASSRPNAIALGPDGNLWFEETDGNKVGRFVISCDSRSPTAFYAVTPCRLFDTRQSYGPDAGSPILAAGEVRLLSITGRCGLPTSAEALSVNVTVAAPGANGHFSLFPAEIAVPPIASSLEFPAGKTRASSSMLRLARDGSQAFKVLNSATAPAHFILDVNGYFERVAWRTFRDQIGFTSAVGSVSIASFNSVTTGYGGPTTLVLGPVTVSLIGAGGSNVFPPGNGFTTNYLSSGVKDGVNVLRVTFPAGTRAAGITIMSAFPITVSAHGSDGDSPTVTFASAQFGVPEFLGFSSASDLQTITISSPAAASNVPIANVGDIPFK